MKNSDLTDCTEMTAEDLRDMPGCRMKQCDFTGCDFSLWLEKQKTLWKGRRMSHCFSESDITDVKGFMEVENFPIDVAISAALKLKGNTLDMEEWHGMHDVDGLAGAGDFCGTTHCRAGWATHLHPQGKELEKVYGPGIAASLIYRQCSVLKRVPNWYEDEDEAIEDIERCAKLALSGKNSEKGAKAPVNPDE